MRADGESKLIMPVNHIWKHDPNRAMKYYNAESVTPIRERTIIDHHTSHLNNRYSMKVKGFSKYPLKADNHLAPTAPSTVL